MVNIWLQVSKLRNFIRILQVYEVNYKDKAKTFEETVRVSCSLSRVSYTRSPICRAHVFPRCYRTFRRTFMQRAAFAVAAITNVKKRVLHTRTRLNSRIKRKARQPRPSASRRKIWHLIPIWHETLLSLQAYLAIYC